MDQPPRREAEREEQQPIRKEWGNRDRPSFRPGSAEKWPKRQDQAGDRKIDQPRPMDIGAEWRVEAILPKVEPALPVEQGADLHHPHFVVGIAEAEIADFEPLPEDEPGAKAEPHQQDEQLPAALDQLGSPPLPFLYLALQHFSGSGRWA